MTGHIILKEHNLTFVALCEKLREELISSMPIILCYMRNALKFNVWEYFQWRKHIRTR